MTTRYLQRQVDAHVQRFFAPSVVRAWRARAPRFVARDEIWAGRAHPGINVAIDVPAGHGYRSPAAVRFNGTDLTIWNPVPKPSGAGWRAFPDSTALWFIHESGVMTPAWDVFGVLMDLLTLAEETESGVKDKHGRFIGSMSPRDGAGLLQVPAFNEAVAVLAGGVLGLLDGHDPRLDLGQADVLPPGITLSHDMDLLRGNDTWTQAVRLQRSARLAMSDPRAGGKHLKFVWFNYRHPTERYLRDVPRFVQQERLFGFESSYYFLVGEGGRYGARSGVALVPAAAGLIPETSAIGVHYPYSVRNSASRLRDSVEELKRMVPRARTFGRAHYLRIDPDDPWSAIDDAGITLDESLGYPDRIGYRAGIAGAFKPLSIASGQEHSLLEVPLVVMDGTLAGQYGLDGPHILKELVQHLAKVGGSLSLLAHPGYLFNPESAVGYTYSELLDAVAAVGARNMPAAAFVDLPAGPQDG